VQGAKPPLVQKLKNWEIQSHDWHRAIGDRKGNAAAGRLLVGCIGVHPRPDGLGTLRPGGRLTWAGCRGKMTAVGVVCVVN
jgi:hypothetical protein